MLNTRYDIRGVYMDTFTRRGYADMQKLRTCVSSNVLGEKTQCGDYWGGNIGTHTNAVTEIRDQYMFVKCNNDTETLRAKFTFNIAPLATIIAPASAVGFAGADSLLAQTFDPHALPYVSNNEDTPTITVNFDKPYLITDLKLYLGTSTDGNAPPLGYFTAMFSKDNVVAAHRDLTSLDQIVSGDRMFDGMLTWSLSAPVLVNRLTLVITGSKPIEMRAIQVYAIEHGRGTDTCSCFVDETAAIMIGYTPYCHSARCKQVDIMTQKYRNHMLEPKTCEAPAIYNCSQIINISDESRDNLFKDVELQQQCGPKQINAPVETVQIVEPIVVESIQSVQPTETGENNMLKYIGIFALLLILSAGAYLYMTRTKKPKKTKTSTEKTPDEPQDKTHT